MSKEAEKRWECFATLCKEMNELADEIIEWSADGHYRDRLIHLYDIADTVFGAKNVKRILAALEEKDKRIAHLESPVDIAALALSITELRKYGESDDCPVSLAESIELLLHEFGRNRAMLAALPADWSKDSSLKTWFPMSAARLSELERITEGVTQDAIDGGWTARGLSEYAYSLEQRLQQPALADVMAERQRQISDENYEAWNDDMYTGGDLADAAACYALHAHNPTKGSEGFTPHNWPWDAEWWKPKSTRRDLVRAGALILAEIERLDRAAAKVKEE